MNYNETRDLIRSLTGDLNAISENFDALIIMFQTDDKGNPTEEAKSQLFFDQRIFLAKHALPRDLKELSQKLIDSIPAIKDYIENWCDKTSDPDINSLSLALGNIIDNKSAKIETLVPSYNDFLSDCKRFRSLIDKSDTKSRQPERSSKYLTDEFVNKLHDSKAFKLAKDDGLIDDDLVWKGSKRSLIDFLMINKFVHLSDSGQYQWKDLDGVFSWVVDRGTNKGQIRQLSKEELRTILSDKYNT